ncbi:MAG: hypothetical protein Q9228_003180 [Teloschistes exilis]
MEVVGGIASVTQLVAYSYVVAQRLVQLHKAVQDGPQLYRARRSHITSLLDSIQRMCLGEAPDTDTILPLLISTADLAHSLLYLLQPKSVLYHLRLWGSRSDEIENNFRALEDKTRLLQLHITERTYNIVATVQKDIKIMSQDRDVHTSKELQPVCAGLSVYAMAYLHNIERPANSMSQRDPSHSRERTVEPPTDLAQQKSGQGYLKLTANENKADGDGGIQRVANGWGTGAGSSHVEANKNEKKGGTRQIVAEYAQVQESGKSGSGSCCSVS